ncbi:trypsin family protein with PDZ domain-containing protein [Actinidia rufa]|uniref:Trypsin family protein with PDZ domain-containing protein n=1 Tax=Actinidia rufa TaxID=165716 RepID=A0A7J0H7U6_9ERIC|nr:trypsin family protein with PDZ domain-containing protein [Actinidia rufa]
MQLIACNSCSSHLLQRIRVPTRTRRCLGRRELCFNGVSLVCSRSEPHHHDSLNGRNDSVSSHPSSTTRDDNEEKNTYSVVNIFDVTLRPQLNVTGVVEIPEGNGSGVVWDGQGHIVTNYHGVKCSRGLQSAVSDLQCRHRRWPPFKSRVQKNFEGKLIGADRAKDLAVLKVEASEELLRPIKVGQSSSLRVGQHCLAIGNPFGFDYTLTVGVISGLNRDIFSQTGVTIGGGVQTDAAINPGNSGGPLLGSKGNLIGINTAIFTQTGTSTGVGFAIPSSTMVKIIPQLIQFGKSVRPPLAILPPYFFVPGSLVSPGRGRKTRQLGRVAS